MRLSYRLKYNGDWHEIGSYRADGTVQPGLVNSQNTSIDTSLFTKDGKSVTNSASFRLTWNASNKAMYIEVMNALLDAIDGGAKIECKITDTESNTALFSGNVDLSSLTITSGMIPTSIDIKAKDHITILDEKVKSNLVYEDMPVNEVVKNLLVEAKAVDPAAIIISTPLPSTKKIQYFVLTDDDDATYRDIIDTLLFEFGCCIYRNPKNDRYEIHKILKTNEPSHQVHYLVSDTLKTSTGLLKSKGAAIIYPNVSTMANARLFTDDVSLSFDEDGNLVGETVEPGAFYPDTGELKAIYQEFDSSYLDREYQEKRSRLQNSHIDLLYVKADTFKLNVNPSEGFTQPPVDLIGKPQGTVLFPRKAWTLLRNNTDKPINLLSLDMTGTAVYKSKLNKLVMPADAANPEEYETSYIFSEEDALAFADFFVNWQNLKRTTATWTEIDKVSNVGDVVVIKHKETDIAQSYVVVEQTMKFIDRENVSYHSVGVALSGYREYSHYEDTYVHKLKPGNIVSSVDEFYYSESKTDLVNGTWQTTADGDDSLFLWKRTKTTYSNGKVTYSTPYFAGGQSGESAKMLRIVADSNVIRYDSSSIPYDDAKASLSLQTSGLSSKSALWTVDGISKGTSETLDIYPEDFERDWIASTASSTARMRCIAQADGVVMMGGVSGAMVYSTDGGDSWATVSSFTGGAITGLCYNKGRYVAVDSNGLIFGSASIASGWSQVYDSGKILNAVTTDGSVFVAVGEQYPGTEGIICKSSNGIDWETIEGAFPNFYAICYDSKKFHAVGAGGIVWASEDGSMWSQTATIGFDCRGISYDGKYIAGGQGGNIAYSNDGKNWYRGTVERTTTTTVSHIRAIGSAYGVYYSVCYLSNGYGEVWKSHNGRDWTVCFEPNAANTRLWAVNFASGYMIASGDNGNVYRLPLPRSLLVRAESEGIYDTISILILQDAIGTSGADGVDGTNGVGIKSTLIDYQKSLSGTEVPTGAWDDTIPTVPQGQYLWTRTVTIYTDDTSYTAYSVSYFSTDGEDVTKEPGIKIEANPNTYTLASRGVCKNEQTISFKAILTEVSGTVNWTFYKNGSSVGTATGENASLTINVNDNCTNIEAKASIVFNGKTYADEVKIFGQLDGNPMPERVRAGYGNNPIPHTVLDSITTLDDGVSPLLIGDYAYGEVYSEAINDYFKTAVVWNGNKFEEIKEDDENFALIESSIMPDALKTAIPEISVLNATIKKLSAQVALINNLFSNIIQVTGALYGGDFKADGNNPNGGAGFHIDAKSGVIHAMDAILERASINGEIKGTHFNSLARSANYTDLNVSESGTYVYSGKTVDTDLLEFVKNTIGNAGIVSASGTYQGTSFSRVMVTATSASLLSSAMFSVSASTLNVYTNGKASTSYPAFTSVTSLTYNGQTFTSSQDKYKLFTMTTAIKDAMHIIKTNVFTVASGNVVCGDITLSGTEGDPISIKTVTPTGTSYSSYIFSQGGQSVTVAKDYNPLPFSISIRLFENLQGVQATNFYRGSDSSAIGTANEPFAAAHITEITSNKINGANMQLSGGIVNISGSGVLNGLKLNGEVNGNVNSSGTEYKVYGSVFN